MVGGVGMQHGYVSTLKGAAAMPAWFYVVL